jgi:squalene-hopene/tetraprenyl-beta-curcumene cyclase
MRAFAVQTSHNESNRATEACFEVAPERLKRAIQRGVDWLLRAQKLDGYWMGELEADSTLESDYILYEHIVAGGNSPKIEKLAACIRQNQLADGGWNIYPGGPSEVNATIKAYFALKLAGDHPQAPHMEKARTRVLELGGIEAANSYTRFYLAMSGAVGWDWVPAVPPELLLLPKWFYVNLLEMSSWTRAIVVPLTIIYARRPDWEIPQSARVEELFRHSSRKPAMFGWDASIFSWRNFFLAMDAMLKMYERVPWKPLRQRALTAAECWLREHLERSEGLATILPAMVNSIYALMALGCSPENPLIAREIAFLERYEIEEQDAIRIQPCISPVWDTAIAMVSLAEAGVDSEHPALMNAAQWLLEKQIVGPGDWQYKNPGVAPGGWAVEFRNDFFPDVDDTAFVLMALARAGASDAGRLQGAMLAGLRWLVSMQSGDGGWGAFDKNNNRAVLTCVPFADHNAMIDPSTADVTARVVECLGRLGWPASHDVVQRALVFLEKDQTAEGAWFGRWGVNYIYGSSGVLRALETIRLSKAPPYGRAAEWLKSVQNPDGGFGESIASYEDPSRKGRGRSTASQTAWAIIGLLAVYGSQDDSVQRAIQYLVERQNNDGSWDEDEFTGTGFPTVFYLKYHLYRNSFPLYALARYRNMLEGCDLMEGRRLPPQGMRQVVRAEPN